MDDYKLVSCGTDGAVYEWNLQNGKRESECVLKSCSYSGVAISPDAKVIFAVGSDHSIKEICDSSVSHCIHTIHAYQVGNSEIVSLEVRVML